MRSIRYTKKTSIPFTGFVALFHVRSTCKPTSISISSVTCVCQEQDEKAIVSLQDRIIQGTQTHEEGFAEWLRQRDQQAMVSQWQVMDAMD